METEFNFRSTKFNCTEPRDYFINEGCYGDDVALWLISELKKQGVKTSAEPEQEDFGWFFIFYPNNIKHVVIIGFQPNDASIGDQWLGWIERDANFLSSILGGRNRGITQEAVNAIDAVLSSSELVEGLSWNEH